VLPDTSANPPTNANVTGTNFTQKPTAAWKDDKGNTLPMLDADVTLKSATEVAVKLGANVTQKNNWKLVLTSPVGLRVSHDY
jgi:hypothetical protein